MWGKTMKALALFGGAGAITAAVAGGPIAIIIGNLAVLAGASALLLGTLNLENAGS